MQRVDNAKVKVSEKIVAEIGQGLVILLGISGNDADSDIEYMAKKLVHLRIFDDKEGKLNLSIRDVEGEILLVSQFTLMGDCRKGRRPSYSHAAQAEKAYDYYNKVAKRLEDFGVPVKMGVFRESMLVEIHNQGPVTLLLDSKRQF